MNAAARPADRYLEARALGRAFAVPARLAEGVFAISTLTAVPGAPAPIVGLTNYRGAIVVVFCLARRLDPRARAAGVGASAIAIAWGAETFALAVESVGALASADASDRIGPLGSAPAPSLDLSDLFGAPASGQALAVTLARLKPSDPGDSP